MQRLLRRGMPTLVTLALAGVVLAGVPGCGSSCSTSDCDAYDTYWGDVYLNNLTDIYPMEEDILEFYIAMVGEPYRGNMLIGTLPPASSQFIGTFHEAYYDAEAWTSFWVDDPVIWEGVWVGEALVVDFDVEGVPAASVP